MKPGDVKNYVHKMSNHPPAVLRNIPKNINDRLCKLSSNEEIFNNAIPPYQEALVAQFWSTLELGYKYQNQPLFHTSDLEGENGTCIHMSG